MNFEKARQAKFDAGKKEHNQPWDLEHIDHLKEIQDECLDLYNYASLESYKISMWFIRLVSKFIWKLIERRR